jgi:hypothetical protein
MHDDVRKFNQLVPGGHFYLEVYLPDSTINAGFRHAGSVMALTYVAARGLVRGARRESFDVTRHALQSNIDSLGDPFGTPVIAAAADYLKGEGGRPRRIHPLVYEQLSQNPVATIIRIPGKQDLWAEDLAPGDGVAGALGMKPLPTQGGTDTTVAATAAIPEKDVGVIEKERYYMSPGPASVLFSMSPLGEINDQLLAWERSPAEASVKEAWMLKWARGTIGAQTGVVIREKSARGDMPRFLKTDTTPPRPEGS